MTLINPQRGMAAVLTEDDGYTIIEMIGGLEVELGDELSWANDYGLGSEMYRNLTQDERDEVYVQNHSVSDNNVRQQLML